MLMENMLKPTIKKSIYDLGFTNGEMIYDTFRTLQNTLSCRFHLKIVKHQNIQV